MKKILLSTILIISVVLFVMSFSTTDDIVTLTTDKKPVVQNEFDTTYEPDMTEDERAEVIEKLKDLGYLE